MTQKKNAGTLLFWNYMTHVSLSVRLLVWQFHMIRANLSTVVTSKLTLRYKINLETSGLSFLFTRTKIIKLSSYHFKISILCFHVILHYDISVWSKHVRKHFSRHSQRVCQQCKHVNEPWHVYRIYNKMCIDMERPIINKLWCEEIIQKSRHTLNTIYLKEWNIYCLPQFSTRPIFYSTAGKCVFITV